MHYTCERKTPTPKFRKANMRKKNILILLCVSTLCLIAFFAGLNFGSPSKVSELKKTLPANMITLNAINPPSADWTLLNKSPFDINSLQGKYVILNFWATWCPPCLVEFPEILDFVDEHQENFSVVFVSSDRDISAIEKFTSKLSPEHKKIMDSKNVIMLHDKKAKITRDIFQSFKLPESYILNKQGQMEFKIIGPLTKSTYQVLSTLDP